MTKKYNDVDDIDFDFYKLGITYSSFTCCKLHDFPTQL